MRCMLDFFCCACASLTAVKPTAAVVTAIAGWCAFVSDPYCRAAGAMPLKTSFCMPVPVIAM